MSRSIRRMLLVALVLAVWSSSAVACSGKGSSKEAFCAKLTEVGDVSSILSDFSGSTAAELEQRFDQGLAKYRDLERAAPRSIRADVAAVADAVEVVLEIVKRHPDDLSAIRRELGAKVTSLATAGKSALQVSTYARDNCGIDLNGGGSGGGLLGSSTTPAAESTTTVG